MNKLFEQKCVPCEGGTLPLTGDEIKKYLSQIDGWELLEEKKIEKKFKFKDFAKALEFVNKVGAIAEKENHHPNIYLFGWNKVKITLFTHAIGGLSINDFILAAKIDNLPKV